MAKDKDVDAVKETEGKEVEKDSKEDLYGTLKKELDKSGEEETPGASAQDLKEDGKKVETAELSEEEISKLSPRAQKRIRDLAEKVKTLAEAATDDSKGGTDAEKKEPLPADDQKKDLSPSFKNVEEFLSKVEDEPSRNLLKTFYGVIKGEMSSTLAPIEAKNNEAKFDSEFAKYEKIEGLVDHKDDLRKTFLRNPAQSLKALISETVADLQLSKVKPLESKPSTAPREKPNTDNLSKDELYDVLDTLKP